MKNYKDRISDWRLSEQPYQNRFHLNRIWDVLWEYREGSIPEGCEDYDEQWSEITYAMAKITEQLELPDNSYIGRSGGT